MKRSYLYITLLLVVLTLGSCKIGKSYVRPELNLPDSLAQHQDSLSFGDKEWWQIYTDSTLRSLIDRALEHNKDSCCPCQGDGCAKTYFNSKSVA